MKKYDGTSIKINGKRYWFSYSRYKRRVETIKFLIGFAIFMMVYAYVGQFDVEYMLMR